MEIITFALLITGVVVLVLIALASWIIGIWPLHKHGPDPTRHDSEERRAKWLALLTCGALVAYSLGLCLAIEGQKRRCGNVLPAPYHPKGWRRASYVSEDFYRMVHNIPKEQALTAADLAQMHSERERAENMNTLHDLVESSVKVHVFVPLALVWLGALALRSRTPTLMRLTAVPIVGCLAVCVYFMATRQYFVALMGD